MSCLPVIVRLSNRRISPVAECPDQGPLTEPPADARSRGWELLFLPHTGPKRRHQPIPEQGKWLGQVVTGHFVYYAVPANCRSLRSERSGYMLPISGGARFADAASGTAPLGIAWRSSPTT